MNLAGLLVLLSDAVIKLLVVGGMAGLLGGIIYWGVWITRRTRQANEAWAQQMGFQFEMKAWPFGETHAEHLALVNKARLSEHYQFKHVFRGRYRHRALTIFDVDYVIGHDQNGNPIHREVSVAAFPCPGRGVPAFELHPQNVLHKLKNTVANHDIAMADLPDFSRKYFLQGADADAVRSFLPASFLQFLTVLDGTHYSVEGGDDWILIYANRVPARRRTRWLEGAMAVLEALGPAAATHA